MHCQRMKPAEFKYVTPQGVEKEKLNKGVPQVDMSILEVSESFHAPPAYSVSNDAFVSYPPTNVKVPDRTPRFYKSSTPEHVKPHNFVCDYMELDGQTSGKQPVESIKHNAQRKL